MKTAGSIGWPWRTVVLSCIFILPFVRFLLQNDYPPCAPEVLLGIGAAFAFCAALALLLRPGPLFAAAVALSICLVGGNTARLLLASIIQLRWRLLIPCLLVLSAVAAWRLRAAFYNTVVVFCLAAVAVDVAHALMPQDRPPRVEQQAATAGTLEHIIYLIFDEHIGPEGMPGEFPEARRARAAVERVLSRHNFDLYPRAFSNYSSTFSSIPSILNHKLLARRGDSTTTHSGRVTVRDDQLIRDFLSRGYAVRLYESDTLELAPPDLDRRITRISYKGNSIGALTHVRWPWPVKLGHIAGSYLQSDTLWSDIGNLAPVIGFHLHPQRVGPLAVVDIWPDRLLADIKNARHKTVFLAHLLTPHYPYVYYPDGRWRDRSEWETDDLIEPLPAGVYARRQRQYAEQVEWLSAQLDGFLTSLGSAGVYDRAQIVVHGDHGSRIRLSRDCDLPARRKIEALGDDVDRAELYDYAAEPGLQELLNRFSTLLAIKRQGSRSPHVDRRTGSVLRFTKDAFYPGTLCAAESGDESVYLFDVSGRPVPIGLAQRWDSEDQTGRTSHEGQH